MTSDETERGDRDDARDDVSREDAAPFAASELTSIGPYTVRRFIAEGGFAWVYEVSDPKFPMRRLALKMLKPEAARGNEFRRFESEARMIAGFDHPNLVTVFDLGRDEKLGCYYYTMNYVAGPTLAAMGRLSIEDAAPIVSAALAGLAQLHDARIVHRDIKPANILITADGRAMLADLGIARDQSSDQRFTRRGSAVGTVRYMSPEQARGQAVEPASDVFSIGLMLYEVLTGKSVYEQTANDMDILFYIGAKFHAGAELEIKFPREIPRSIQEVIRKACRMSRDERYANAREMRAALQAALGALGPRGRIRPWQIAAGLGAVAAIGAGGWAGSYLWTRREARSLDRAVFEAGQLAKDVLESVAASQPPPDFAMLSGTQQQFDTAEVTRQNGRRELEAGRYDDASTYLRLALQGFEGTCERLATEQLEPQLKAVRDDLDARGRELEALGAASLTPARWTEFQSKQTALTAGIDAPSACRRSDHLRVRAADASGVLAVATQIFAELANRMSDLARVAREEAEAARGAAIRIGTESDLYRELFERGERAYVEGKAKADSGLHVEARDALHASAVDFEEAAQVGQAVVERARVGEAEQRALERRVEDFGVASVVLSRAEERFAARDWSAARASYERAIGEIDALVAAPEPPPPPPPPPENRPPALSIAAKSSGPLRVGQSREFVATPTDPDGDPVAIEFSVDAVPAASGSEFRFAPEKPGTYRIAALATDAQGATATDAIEVEVSANRAPRLEVAIEPASDWIEGREALLKASAQDPDGDPVEISYTIGGREVARGNTYRFEPERAGQYLVTAMATDALGAQTSVERMLTVRAAPAPTPAPAPAPKPKPTPDVAKPIPTPTPAPPPAANRPPEIAWASGGAALEMKVGEDQALEARATDPDGDPVAISYELDGRMVGEGATYRFSAQAEGSFLVAAIARDGRGAIGQIERQIRVIPDTRKPDISEQASRTLRAYAEAYEARDIERLRKIYVLNPEQVRSMSSFFAASDEIRMEIRTLASRLEGDTIVVDFDQKVSASNTHTPDRFIPLRATLSRQAEDRWVIVGIRGR